jgi:hypothetical protein
VLGELEFAAGESCLPLPHAERTDAAMTDAARIEREIVMRKLIEPGDVREGPPAIL